MQMVPTWESVGRGELDSNTFSDFREFFPRLFQGPDKRAICPDLFPDSPLAPVDYEQVKYKTNENKSTGFSSIADAI